MTLHNRFNNNMFRFCLVINTRSFLRPGFFLKKSLKKIFLFQNMCYICITKPNKMIQRLINFINRAHLRFMAFRYKDYSSKEIMGAISMYYDIVADIVRAKSFDEIKPMFIDIEVFKKRFKGTIPPDIYNDRVERLWHILDLETQRIMGIKKK